jgi:hypothetical protein
MSENTCHDCVKTPGSKSYIKNQSCSNMVKPKDIHQDAAQFADILKGTKFNGQLTIGKFILFGRKGVADSIQYNQAGHDMLQNRQEYTFPIQDGDLQVSLQLYKNILNHYRLFCYTKINKKKHGMTFSVNLTTKKESDNVIFLSQKIKFTEQYGGSKQLAQAHRRQKQIVFCDLLSKLKFNITENEELILGIFDPIKKSL